MKYTYIILLIAVNYLSASNVLLDTIASFTEKKELMVLPPCDACSSSSSGGGTGFGSLLNSNFIGLRYLNQNYDTKSGNFGNSPWANDQFNTLTVQGRVSIIERLAVSAQWSYHTNQRRLTTLKQINADQKMSGIGDAVVLAFYNVINRGKTDSTSVAHKVNVGSGVKVPFGEFTETNSGGNNPAFQLGTGSWDYIIALEYLVKKEKIGINAQASYIIKTENNVGYQFGNQLSYGATLFYALGNGKLKVYPQIGIQGEQYDHNKINNVKVIDTEGNVLFGKTGFELSYNDWSLGVNYFTPIEQNLMTGNLIANNRFSIQLNYLL